MIVRQVGKVESSKVPAGENTSMQVLISAEEAPHFAMRKFSIGPGGSMPEHTNTIEHEQYVLGGKAKVTIGTNTLEAVKNDIIFIPAGIPHSYATIGDEPYEFLCLVPNEKDVIELTGK